MVLFIHALCKRKATISIFSLKGKKRTQTDAEHPSPHEKVMHSEWKMNWYRGRRRNGCYHDWEYCDAKQPPNENLNYDVAAFEFESRMCKRFTFEHFYAHLYRCLNENKYVHKIFCIFHFIFASSIMLFGFAMKFEWTNDVCLCVCIITFMSYCQKSKHQALVSVWWLSGKRGGRSIVARTPPLLIHKMGWCAILVPG